MGNFTRVAFLLLNFFALASVASARPTLPFPFPFPIPGAGPVGPGAGGPGWGHGPGDGHGGGHGGPGWGHGGGGGGNGRTVTINNPRKDGYVLFSGNFREATAQQVCRETGYEGGRVLSLDWIANAPAAEFANGWRYYPQANNYQSISSIECSSRGNGPGPGPGPGGRPDMTYSRPLYNNYPLYADNETADAYCRNQGFRRSQIMQTVFVERNPAYYSRNGQWIFNPRAERYQMINLLGCSRF